MTSDSPSLQPAPTVVMVRPQKETEVGAVATAMATMGLVDLILVEPAVSVGRQARSSAAGARPRLEGASRAPSLDAAVAAFQRVVSITSPRRRRPRVPLLHPRELPAFLAGDPPGTRSALIFGPEPPGLTREELALCCPMVAIPTAPGRASLDLGQRLLIVAYELFTDRTSAPHRGTRDVEPLASVQEIEGLFRYADATLERVGLTRDESLAEVRRDLRRWAAQGMTRRQATLLRELSRRLESLICSLQSPPTGEPPHERRE